METRTPPPPPPAQRRATPRRRALKITLSVVLSLFLVAGAAAYWALDRYVIVHVVIADVDAYEAAVLAAGVPEPAVTETAGGAPTEAAPTTEPEAFDDSVFEVTSDTYVSDSKTVTISKVVTGTGTGTVTYYVADVVVSDVTELRSAFANNQFGTNIIAATSAIAEDNDAVFAINGDYYGFRRTGILVRNGVVYRDQGARVGLAIYLDGTMAVYDETTTTAGDLLAEGVWSTLSFGPALLEDGGIVDGIEDVEIDTNFGNHSIQGAQPRTGLGMIAPNHFVFVVVDGRSPGYSRGVTMTEFAQIFQDLGCTVAYNLDGGGSATMYFNGDLVNIPLGRGNERGTSDILYLDW